MDTSSENNKSEDIQNKHDEKLSEIFGAENKSINKFFDAVFGYFFRNSPELVFDTSKQYGKQVVISNYERWQKQYLKSQTSPVTTSKRAKNDFSPTTSEKSSPKEDKDSWNPGGPTYTYTTNTATMSKRVNDSSNTSSTGSKKEQEKESTSPLDTTKGAQLDSYAWTQSIEDLEARVDVPKYIRKGSQVKVDIGGKSLKVEIASEKDDKKFEVVVEGKLLHSIRVDDSAWFLSPGQHISVLLEKSEDVWWNRLLLSETPINLSMASLERDYCSMPEAEKKQIEKVISDRQKVERGELTSDQEKLNAVLKKAWDAEGSPFKGQPFDPSRVKLVNPS